MAERSSARTAAAEPGQAPGALEKVRMFVNTLDIDEGTEALTDPVALANWLRINHLDAAGAGAAGPDATEARIAGTRAAGAVITEADFALALRLREGLRAALQSHAPAGARDARADDAGERGAERAAAELQEIAAGLPVRLEVGADGGVRAAAGGSGGTTALARLLLITVEASTLGTWPRLKVCSADSCRWAFYDRSPTRTGCWCTMRACGSRAKSRTYRRRTALRAPDDPVVRPTGPTASRRLGD
jgi:predicted RNA-binding Zn ribbon-like protein